MRLSTLSLVFLVVTAASAQSPYKPTEQQLLQSYLRANTLQTRAADNVFNLALRPHWFGGHYLWYRSDLKGKAKEFVLADGNTGARQPAFDHAKLADALAKQTGDKIDAAHLPFDSIVLSDDLSTVTVGYKDSGYAIDLRTYAVTKAAAPSADATVPGGRGRRPAASPEGYQPAPQQTSPDGKLEERISNGQVEVRPKGGEWAAVTSEGSFSEATWDADSAHLIAFRLLPGDHHKVYLLHSTGDGKTRATLEERLYDQPGDKLDAYEPYVIDVQAHKETKVPLAPLMAGSNPWPNAPGARPWAGSFLVEYPIRGYGQYEVVRIDPATGQPSTVVDEKSTTFIDVSHMTLRTLEKSHEVLWSSERSGWTRLYLINADTGAVENPVTPDGGVYRQIQYLDEANREVWFSASGLVPGQDPYQIHYYKVKLDGTGLVALTQGDGTHTVNFSPDRSLYVDTYSRVDLPPVHELHRSSDGKMLCVLEKADISGLLKTGLKLPERFVAKGRDGQTDIWGVVIRPSNFDSHKKYPVIENIYAGPQDSFVPKAFAPFMSMTRLAELGFIVVQIDGMGTGNRGKKFHDVCFKNIADAGFPDRILWMQALNKKMPQADITRVGVYGTSAGGQNAAGAVLWHPEFYKAAVASCGCHDNRIDKQWWNEQWMSYPVGPEYADQSNITQAGRLRGHLMLFVGEDDHNVPPESTMRLVDALIKANKEFDYLMLPGMDHTDGGPYGERKRRDFFVRWLLGVTPPTWNDPTTLAAASAPPAAGRVAGR